MVQGEAQRAGRRRGLGRGRGDGDKSRSPLRKALTRRNTVWAKQVTRHQVEQTFNDFRAKIYIEFKTLYLFPNIANEQSTTIDRFSQRTSVTAWRTINADFHQYRPSGE